jgi:hypothetical protein
MKDAQGHGSNGKGALEGAAAHKRMVQKFVQGGNTHAAIVHTLTRYDREQQDRTARGVKGAYYNPYALGHYMAAAGRISEDIGKGVKPGQAINNHVTGGIANRLHKALGTGEKAPKY